MDFGPFGAAEFVFIALLALVVLGPVRLARAGRTVGQTLTKLRRATNDLRHAFESEVDDTGELGEEARRVRELGQQVREVGGELRGLSRALKGQALGGGGGDGGDGTDRGDDDPEREASWSRPMKDEVRRVHAEMRAIGHELKEAGDSLERAPAVKAETKAEADAPARSDHGRSSGEETPAPREASGGTSREASGGTSREASGGTSCEASGGTSREASGGTSREASGGTSREASGGTPGGADERPR